MPAATSIRETKTRRAPSERTAVSPAPKPSTGSADAAGAAAGASAAGVAAIRPRRPARPLSRAARCEADEVSIALCSDWPRACTSPPILVPTSATDFEPLSTVPAMPSSRPPRSPASWVRLVSILPISAVSVAVAASMRLATRGVDVLDARTAADRGADDQAEDEEHGAADDRGDAVRGHDRGLPVVRPAPVRADSPTSRA